MGPDIAANPPDVAKPVTMLVAIDWLIRPAISEAISRCGRSNEIVELSDIAISQVSSHSKHFHYLVAKMINDLYCNATGLWFIERSRDVAIKSCPCFFVDFCLQRCLQ